GHELIGTPWAQVATSATATFFSTRGGIMKTSVLGAVLAAIALCTSVHAATPVALMTPVSFDPSTDKREEVKTECKLGEMIETHVGNALRRANKGPGTTTSM